jgi:ABC-type sugar transport system ATPase subunit
LEVKKPSKESFQSTVYLTELLGSKFILHLGVEEKIIKAIAPLTLHAEFGGSVWLHINPDKIYVFDKKTEKS